MEVSPKHKSGPTVFENLDANDLPRIHFLNVMLTVVDMMLTWCDADTAATVPMAQKACIQYDGARTFEGDRTGIVQLLTVGPTI